MANKLIYKIFFIFLFLETLCHAQESSSNPWKILSQQFQKVYKQEDQLPEDFEKRRKALKQLGMIETPKDQHISRSKTPIVLFFMQGSGMPYASIQGDYSPQFIEKRKHYRQSYAPKPSEDGSLLFFKMIIDLDEAQDELELCNGRIFSQLRKFSACDNMIVFQNFHLELIIDDFRNELIKALDVREKEILGGTSGNLCSHCFPSLKKPLALWFLGTIYSVVSFIIKIMNLEEVACPNLNPSDFLPNDTIAQAFPSSGDAQITLIPEKTLGNVTLQSLHYQITTLTYCDPPIPITDIAALTFGVFTTFVGSVVWQAYNVYTSRKNTLKAKSQFPLISDEFLSSLKQILKSFPKGCIREDFTLELIKQVKVFLEKEGFSPSIEQHINQWMIRKKMLLERN